MLDVILFYLSWIFYLVSLLSFIRKFEKVTFLKKSFFIAWFLHTSSIITRFILYGYFPVVSLYETLVYISFSISLLYLMLRKKMEKIKFEITLSILLLNFTTLLVSNSPGIIPDDWKIWLFIHIPIGLASYGYFLISFMASILFLANTIKKKKSKKLYDFIRILVTRGSILFFFCIITGGVWAMSAWGSFWGWDPKETASLFILIAYTSVAILFKFNKKNKILNIILTLFSFFLVIFNFLIVNLLISGLHSYV